MKPIIQTTVDLGSFPCTVGLSDYLAHADDMGEIDGVQSVNLHDYRFGYVLQMIPGQCDSFSVIHAGEASKTQGLDPISAALIQNYKDPSIGNLIQFDHRHVLYFVITPKITSPDQLYHVPLLILCTRKFSPYHRSQIYEYFTLRLTPIKSDIALIDAVAAYLSTPQK